MVELGKRLTNGLEEVLSSDDEADKAHLHGVHKACSSLADSIHWVFSSGHIDLGSLRFDIFLELQEVSFVGSRCAVEYLYLHKSHVLVRPSLLLA